ncbi:MAG: hypothetical protein FJY67_02530 [Calditrichaeota bacterium]|nr:hypothetical protein [Calditrichota bacterium]
MAHSYTPGLRVARQTRIVKERRLPLRGDVLVQIGDLAAARQVVARTELPGNVHPLNCCGQLGILPADIETALLLKPGSPVAKDQEIACASSFFGLFKSRVHSPIVGTLESASPVTGQLILREPPIPVEVSAYIDGTVSQVFPGEGIEIECRGAFIQGIFGIGGERHGTIRMMVASPDRPLDAADITGDVAGMILVGGRRVTLEGFRKAVEKGAVAVVAGGFLNNDLKRLLGYEQGVAITGHEEVGATLILTEGFGDIAMAARTFGLLKENEGRGASVSGATQIRAGVIRPEVIIPIETAVSGDGEAKESGGLDIDDVIRVIRQPWFGRIGRVTGLPAELQLLESGAKVRVLEADLGDGERIILPRANVELIEE